MSDPSQRPVHETIELNSPVFIHKFTKYIHVNCLGPPHTTSNNKSEIQAIRSAQWSYIFQPPLCAREVFTLVSGRKAITSTKLPALFAASCSYQNSLDPLQFLLMVDFIHQLLCTFHLHSRFLHLQPVPMVVFPCQLAHSY